MSMEQSVVEPAGTTVMESLKHPFSDRVRIRSILSRPDGGARFMGSNVDFRGQDFELLPFSAGRRMCPGMPLAARQIPLLLANLVWNFDWCLPNKTELDMEEKFGITLQKESPLVLVPRRLSSLSE